MKKAIAMILTWLMLLTLLCACGAKKPAETYTVYYRVTEQEQSGGGDILQACEVQIPGGSRMDKAALGRALLEKLFSRQAPLGCKSPVEIDVQVMDVTVQETVMTVRVNDAYASLRGLKRSLADYAMALTLCRLEGVEQVLLRCGEEERLLSPESALLSMESRVEEIPVELYYLDKAGDLVAVDHLLLVPEGEVAGELLLRAMRQAPASAAELQPLVQEEYLILSTDLQGESYYINLDKDTVRLLKQSGLEQETYLAMEMSLRSLENIKSVVFMNEGSVIYRNEDIFPVP